MGFRLRRAVQADFPYVPGLGQKGLEECEFTMPFVGDLRVEAESCPDAGRTSRKGTGSSPRPWGCSHGQHMMPLLATCRDDGRRVGVQIQVAVEIDHTATLEAAR